MNPFKIQDLVKCVDAGFGNAGIQNGKAYRVERVCGNMICVEGVDGRFFAHRFVSAALPKRSKNGRFVSTVSANSKKISPNNIIPFPTMAQSSKIPASLKRGAIYKVTGVGFFHLRGNAYGDFVVMSAFGKPIVVDKARLRIADAEDVNQFIADERAAKSLTR